MHSLRYKRQTEGLILNPKQYAHLGTRATKRTATLCRFPFRCDSQATLSWQPCSPQQPAGHSDTLNEYILLPRDLGIYP